MSNSIIKVKNLEVVYHQGKPNEVRSLDKVSLEVYPQEYVIIFGPSGCGKSTLLYSISGLQVPTAGEVEVIGKKLSQIDKKEMVKLHQSGVGMIFQAFYLIPSLTVVDNVALPKVFRRENKTDRKVVSEKLLERFSIRQHANKFPTQLSGGEKQRVSIARSLINNPNLILADEPVGNLDSESAENVLNILRELNETDKKTIIMVTHNPDHLHFADRVIYMRDGKIVKEEVNKEKRPKAVLEKGLGKMDVPVSQELKMLMRTFRGLSPEQIGSLLTPYKADQLLNYVLSDLSNEQIAAANDFLKRLLFKNMEAKEFVKKLDKNFEDGGAEWNKTRAESFGERISAILKQAKILEQNNSTEAANLIAKYLIDQFKLNLQEERRILFVSFLQLRIENEIDRAELNKKLDNQIIKGGLGLHKGTAEKVSREMEMIKFLNYQA